MTLSLANVALDPNNWIDLCAIHPVLANTDATIQFRTPTSAQIYHGGTVAPATLSDGDPVQSRDRIYANSDHLWAVGHGFVSITIL